MKTKLKSMSKRTLSIILVLLMVVSTVTVGIITTTAAYTELDNEAVGASVDEEETVGASVDEEDAGGGQDVWRVYYSDGTEIANNIQIKPRTYLNVIGTHHYNASTGRCEINIGTASQVEVSVSYFDTQAYIAYKNVDGDESSLFDEYNFHNISL